MSLSHRVGSLLNIRWTVPACCLAGVLVGCGRQDVQVYEVPKEKTASAVATTNAGLSSAGLLSTSNAAQCPASMMTSSNAAKCPASMMQGMAPTPGDTPQPAWTVPAGWQEQPASMMVMKAFSVSGENGAKATVNVVVLAGEAGGKFANVNRWRGQMGLAPITETELDKAIQPLDVNGTKATLVELSGKDPRDGKPAQMLVAMVPHGPETWFYKAFGDGSVVTSQKENFLKFVRSVHYP